MTKLNVRDKRANRRFFIDNSFFRGGWAKALGPRGIAVYAALALHADVDKQNAWPSLDTIGELTGMSRPTVIKAVKDMEALNIISVERRSNRANIYYLMDAEEWVAVKNFNTSVKQVDSGVKNLYTNNTKEQDPTNNTKESDEPSPPPPTITAKHPAIKAFKSAAHRYPAKSWFKKVGDAVGTNTDDVQFWRDVVFGWVGSGWNPTNVKGMLDCFEQRRIPGTNGGKRNGSTFGGPNERKASLAIDMGPNIAELLGDKERIDAGG